MLPCGVYPAAVTPFEVSGKIDVLSMPRLLASFEAAGCVGAVVAGTNGEGPSLSAPDKRDLIRDAIRCKGKLKILLGIASSSLDEAVWLAKQAAKAGSDGLLVMPPSYFREATEDNIIRWFDAVFEATDLPVLAYNFPQRTGIALTPAMIESWHRYETFAGIKDSSGECNNLSTFRVEGDRRRFVGDETLLPAALSAGWSGSISGLSNVIPHWMVHLFNEGGDSPEWLPALKTLRSLPQPAVHKSVLHRLGIIADNGVKLPLRSASDHELNKALEILEGTFGIRPGVRYLPT